MKRIVLTVVSTVAGIVALLSYKTHGQFTSASSTLPLAGIPATAASPSASGSSPVGGSAPSSSSTPSPTANTYVGTAEDTRYGIVQVKITISGTHITNVGFVQLTAFDGRSARINNAAGPVLLRETLDAQSARIDGVSGASYTSQGYEQSLQSALDKAGIR
jgi:uncharacterized protein with FMN-binding domain